MLNWLWQRILNVLTWVSNLISDLAEKVYFFLLDMLEEGAKLVLQLLPEDWQDFLNALDFSGLTEAMAPVAYLFPLTELFLIIVTAYAICGGIRFVRWLIATIPTLNL